LIDRVGGDASLDEVLAWRVPELIAYQDRAYAQRYTDVVARARAGEVAAGRTDSAFSVTVARNLFHLMAYKDEYEVARLHRRREWRRQVDDEFGANSRISFHLQPPAATRFGLDRKIALGERTAGLAFWGLERMRGVRGTRLDPFGRTAERRDERALIDEYIALIDRLLPHLGSDSADESVRIAGLVDMVRGFAAVKRRNLDRYRVELAAALAELSTPTGGNRQ
jgi:indolepyruvate ferredoxin oxidoreductase